jgi:hypothetical protein
LVYSKKSLLLNGRKSFTVKIEKRLMSGNPGMLGCIKVMSGRIKFCVKCEEE